MSTRTIKGRWIWGPDAGQGATLFDVRAGRVYGRRSDGSPVFGVPSAFVADTGETGDDLLEILLPAPIASTLHHGAVREALASAHSLAVLGRQETRAWEHHNRYVVDDGEGNCGVVDFHLSGPAGALYNHDHRRDFRLDAALALAPVRQQEALYSLVDLPFFRRNGGQTITAVFWTERGVLHGPEPWYKAYISGGEVLRRELLEDDDWRQDSYESGEHGEAVVELIVRLAGRLVSGRPISLAREELSILAPPEAPFYTEALEQLRCEGVFEFA